MTDEADDRSERWALPASVVAHALVAALVIFGLPESAPQPEEEQAVSVTIEPPPGEAEAAAAAPPPAPPAEPAEPTEPEEPPPPAAQEQAAAAPIPVLQPVVKFGETDAGPREALDGSAAEDTPDPPTQSVAQESPDEAEQENPAEDEAPPAETAEDSEEAESDASAQTDSADDESTGASAPQLVASTAGEDAPPPSGPEQAATAAASEPELQEARRLFSRSATGGATATTAMADLPRGVRAGRLCETELLLQLRYGATPYSPELLPSLRLDEGTVLAIPRGAFRARGTWYDLSFECQIDPEATHIVSFALRVGAPLSPEEQQQRGLPSR
jgi:hypothetical protein